jgi:hypothetical protein
MANNTQTETKYTRYTRPRQAKTTRWLKTKKKGAEQWLCTLKMKHFFLGMA